MEVEMGQLLTVCGNVLKQRSHPQFLHWVESSGRKQAVCVWVRGEKKMEQRIESVACGVKLVRTQCWLRQEMAE
eukprot:9332669-Ditylum_brightwellii.AAC.1